MTSILENKKADGEALELSEEETKHFLTPFAFKMDTSLFGLPLASPTKRGIAILVDFAVIALISDVSGVFLAFAIAVTLYYLGKNSTNQVNDKVKGQKRRAVMRFIGAFILFIVLLDTLPPLMKYMSGDEQAFQTQLDDKSLSLGESLTLGAITLSTMQTIDDSHCKTLACWQNELNIVAIDIADIGYEEDINITPTQIDDIFKDTVQEIDLPKNEQVQILAAMHDSYANALIKLKLKNDTKETEKPIDSLLVQEQVVSISSTQKQELTFEQGDEEGSDLIKVKDENIKKPIYSVVEWVKGIINDLGLGFGWATFYFTAFTSLGQGQTLGKKILGIKVLQLDGTPLSLWDSFGRYGGYGAGLATGLLGFIQIYWDPNKQAIHDKISSTVVIDLRAARLNKSVHG